MAGRLRLPFMHRCFDEQPRIDFCLTDSGRLRHNLLEPSILPVQRRHRSIGTLGFTWIWIGIAFMIATFQLGATGVAGLRCHRS